MRSSAMARLIVGASVTASMLAAGALHAHHSSRGVYDRDAITEVRGVLTEMFWVNPHVRLTVRAVGDDGREEIWRVEGASVSILGRKGLSTDVLEVGDRIVIAGNPAIRDVNEMYFTNLLLPGGLEVMTLPGAEPRFSDDSLLWSQWSELAADEVDEAERRARGIFRVWTTNFAAPDWRLWNDSYPLTEAAERAQAAWDPVNSPYVSCIKGMPSIMEQPYPIEFVDEGDNIVLRIEEYDVVRMIEMQPSDAAERAPAPWGHSVGRWEASTLVVTTTGISWPYFDQTGIPLSETAVLVERFTPTADGTRLDYALTVTDPLVFTEPAELTRHWVWRPGERIKPFNCVLSPQ